MLPPALALVLLCMVLLSIAVCGCSWAGSGGVAEVSTAGAAVVATTGADHLEGESAVAQTEDESPALSAADTVSSTDSVLAAAFAERSLGLLVEGRGTVIKLLADDTQGDRHQRFIVSLDSGQTLLVVHNVDVAPRVSSLQVGDAVAFKGEYVWNEQGGLIHWTHRDPGRGHEVGWIKHEGVLYQ